MTAENPAHFEEFTVWKEDEHYVIHQQGGPTTQGESLIEALLMMADAIREDEHDTQTMMKMAADIFIMDPEDKRFIMEEL